MQLTFVLPAGPNTRFAPGCLDDQLGQRVTVRLPGRDVATECVLLAVSYPMDGLSLEVTVEVPGHAVDTVQVRADPTSGPIL